MNALYRHQYSYFIITASGLEFHWSEHLWVWLPLVDSTALVILCVFRCAGSAVYKIRQMAARAIVPLVAKEQLVDILSILLQSLPAIDSDNKCQNLLHGICLQVSSSSTELKNNYDQLKCIRLFFSVHACLPACVHVCVCVQLNHITDVDEFHIFTHRSWSLLLSFFLGKDVVL